MNKRSYPRFRRIHLLVRKRFQITFMLSFISVLLFVSLFYGIFLYGVLEKRFEESFLSPHLSVKSTVEILWPSLFAVNLSFFLLMAFLSAVLMISLSKRISRPFHALHLDASQVEKGKLWIEESPKSGHLGVLVGENFIKAVKDVRGKIIQMNDLVASLKSLTGKLKLLSELKEPPREKAKEILAEIESRQRELDSLLSGFKTE